MRQRPSRRWSCLVLLQAVALVLGCAPRTAPDLVITRAALFDPRTLEVLPDRTVVIADGDVREVLAPGRPTPRAKTTIDAHGRLLTPGLVDAHGHSAEVLGDSITAGGGFVTRLSEAPDSIAAYRRRYAAAYLPFGVTSVRDVGSAEADLPMLLSWTARSFDLPDVFPSGGALVSREEGRVPFQGHAVVNDSAGAVAKVREYHALGIRHIKLYWRLREPELSAAFAEARRLGMDVTGHIDFGVAPFERTMELGLTSFEHAYTLGVGVMTPEELARVWAEEVPAAYGDRQGARFYLGALECFNHLGPDDPRMLRLIDRLAELDATVDPTLHIFAQRVGLAAFATPPHAAFDDDSGLTPKQLDHARAGYRVLAGYVKRLHSAGVKLAVGSDWTEPGRVCLSEMGLLHEAGIPMADVLAIATLGSAAAIGADDVIGTIEPGKRANLILWDRSPLEKAANLWGGKTVIKDGQVFGPARP